MTQETTTNNVWQQHAETFWPSNTTLNAKRLPPAIYRYGTTPDGRWFLEKTASRYVFPYKIYGAQDHIIARVKAAWTGLASNFGILLNGLKGTGKTITAQLIVNWAIDQGMAVLNVQHPMPLATVLDHIEQPLLVLFDEFEKTHQEDGDDEPATINGKKQSQQHLLSAIDGLSKNEHRRLFVFTTNEKKINPNLIDRPSRIRYNWEFTRVGTELIDMLLDDMLDKKLQHLKPEIVAYLNTRAVLTIDAVKTVIVECNIFKESPTAFEDFMNLTRKEPGSYKLHIVDEMGGETVVSEFFRPQQGPWLQSIMTKTGRQNFIETYCARGTSQSIYNGYGQTIEILGPTDKDNEWICHVQIPAYRTWASTKLAREADEFLWIDEKPANWRAPEWARKFEHGAALTEQEQEQKDEWTCGSTVYGGEKKKKVRLRFTLDETPYVYNQSSMFDND